MMATRERRGLVLVALLLVVVTVLLALQVGHCAPIAWVLVPVFLFAAVEAKEILTDVLGEVRLPGVPARPSLFERPPPYFG